MNGSASPSGRRLSLARLGPLLVLLAGLGLALAFGLDDYLSCGSLRDNRIWLLDQVARHGWLAGAAFMAIYATAVALSVPGAVLLTVAGGFLFGTIAAAAMVVVSATAGATAVFLAARSALGEPLRARAGPWLGRLERGFAENALSYLLVLRLVPLFPFFVVNIVPAFLGVTLRTYLIGTFFGIIPGTFVFASVGAGLGSIFDAGGTCSLEGVLTTEVVIALVGLALLALLPVAYKQLAARRNRRRPD